MAEGKVFLVGAGPGDPGLLTVKGLRAIQQAEVIFYDDLANSDLLGEAPDGCETIYVGKRAGFRSRSQEETCALLVEHARSGKTVVRLKGGDPFVFGRGGEEADALQKAGVPFEVVPGITSAIAAPAYAGIPVTHRGVSTHVTIVTGHEDPEKGRSDVDWGALARTGGTLVVLMGAGGRAEIARKLIEGGRAPDTPVAAVRWGTRPNQVTVRGRLDELAKMDVAAPSAIVIGGVAALDFSWFESLPLFGVRIAVTRTREQASELVSRLRQLGADVLELPTIKIVDPDDWGSVDRAVEGLGEFDWLVFTSANAVERLFTRMQDLKTDTRALAGVRIAAVGPGTAARVRSCYLRVDLCPTRHTAEGLLEAFSQEGGLKDARFLIPRPEVARDILPNGLRNAGAEVYEPVVYKTVRPDGLPDGVLDRLENGEIDLVTFASSSSARNFVDLLGEDRFSALRDRLDAVSIGPITTQAAEALGFRVVAEPAEDEVSIPGMVRAIVNHCQRRR